MTDRSDFAVTASPFQRTNRISFVATAFAEAPHGAEYEVII